MFGDIYFMNEINIWQVIIINNNLWKRISLIFNFSEIYESNKTKFSSSINKIYYFLIKIN